MCLLTIFFLLPLKLVDDLLDVGEKKLLAFRIELGARTPAMPVPPPLRQSEASFPSDNKRSG